MAELLANRLLLTTLIALLLLLAIAWAAGRVRVARQARDLLDAVNSSQRGQVKLTRSPGPHGFAGTIQPPPDPFVQLTVDYRTAPAADLLGPFTRHGDFLVVTGRFPQRPAAELVWQQGQVPARALAHRERSLLWVQRHLDVTDAEYAVRGANPGALEHVFFDLQTRFRPFLVTTTIQADVDPELTVVLRLARFNLRDIPALLTSTREFARAALRS